MSISTGKQLPFCMTWLLNLGILIQICHVISVSVFGLETEAPDETAMSEKDTVPPTEEASTEEVIVPTGASDILKGFDACVHLELCKLVQSDRVQMQEAKINEHITWKTVAVLYVLAPEFRSIITNMPC